ncbi:MAG: hypothetical protein HGA61_03050 [Candidatus Moranbacteria bacterium]|nr:hypothetical protein [Candidatus Moranbacteria bacterium]
MKKIEKLLVSMAMFLLLTNPVAVFATGNDGDIIVTSDNANNNINTVTSTATSSSTATGGNSNATLNYTERMQLPSAPSLVTPSNGTGGVIMINNHLITQSRLSDELAAFPSFSVTQVKTAITFMDKSEGADSWGSVNGRIKVYPVVTNPRQPLPEGDPIYFLDPARVRFSDGFVIGRIVYNGKDKKNPVLLNQFLMRVALDAASVGANAVVFTEQFHQSSVVTKADGISVGGFFSKILGCFSGGSVGGSGGLSSGSVTEFGVAGIAVTMLYIPNQPCQPVVEKACDTDAIWARIHSLEKEVESCERYCYNNLTLRDRLGKDYIELYVCTGDKKYLNNATYHFEVAERNYLKGWDINTHRAEASQIIARDYYLQAGCVLLTQGKTAAISFANAKRLERIPIGFSK